MFGISHLLSIIPTALSLTIFVGSLTTIATSVTLTSIKIHSKRSALRKSKAKNVKGSKTLRFDSKSKNLQNTKTKDKVQTKQVVKDTSKKTITKAVVKPANDKSNLIGEENVTKADLSKNSKYNWVYDIQLKCPKKPENNIALSWKTNDKKSIIESLIKDVRTAKHVIVNKNLTDISLTAKYLNENNEVNTYSRSNSFALSVHAIKELMDNATDLLNKMGSVKQVKNQQKEDEHTL